MSKKILDYLIHHTILWKNKRLAKVCDSSNISFAYWCFLFFAAWVFTIFDRHQYKDRAIRALIYSAVICCSIVLMFITLWDVHEIWQCFKNYVLFKHHQSVPISHLLCSFAQWQYHSQWSNNWGVVFANWKLNPIPAGKDLKHSPPSNFCKPVKATVMRRK